MSLRLSELTEWHILINHRNGHLLTRFGSSHPRRRFSRLLFLCLDSPHLRCPTGSALLLSEVVMGGID